ncbi:hypothetical protein [Rhabdochromatium marinum]|uniref:hypothetical protein n=1 Tax=Rhabdochromatium marinum TaxID=48729 RepID=UPI001908F3B4|nr:hypothetical protein [Rhabdochromatium marinum]
MQIGIRGLDESVQPLKLGLEGAFRLIDSDLKKGARAHIWPYRHNQMIKGPQRLELPPTTSTVACFKVG